jgi:hypothetical protein
MRYSQPTRVGYGARRHAQRMLKPRLMGYKTKDYWHHICKTVISLGEAKGRGLARSLPTRRAALPLLGREVASLFHPIFLLPISLSDRAHCQLLPMDSDFNNLTK